MKKELIGTITVASIMGATLFYFIYSLSTDKQNGGGKTKRKNYGKNKNTRRMK